MLKTNKVSLRGAKRLFLVKRFEIHYTPIHGNWLNIAEIEITAMAKQSINRRIPSIEKLIEELKNWTKEKNESVIRVKELIFQRSLHSHHYT